MGFSRKFGVGCRPTEWFDTLEAPEGAEKILAVVEGALGRWPDQRAARAVRRKVFDGLSAEAAAKKEKVDSHAVWRCLRHLRREVGDMI